MSNFELSVLRGEKVQSDFGDRRRISAVIMHLRRFARWTIAKPSISMKLYSVLYNKIDLY